MPGSFSLPNPSSPATGDAPTSAPIRNNFQAIQTQLNNADGAALNSKSVPESALADSINPRLARTESGATYVASGLTAGFSSLTASISAGVAYVNGYRQASLGGTATLGINKDYYADMDTSGNITFGTGVSNNATAPVLATGSIRLAKFVVSGTAIVQALQNIPAAPVAPNTTNWTGADSLGNIVYSTGAASAKSLVNPYKFRVYRSTAFTLAGGSVFTLIPFDTKVYDTGINANVSTGVFTAPVAGFYHFSWNVLCSTTATTQIVVAGLYINGAQNAVGSQLLSTGANTLGSSGSVDVQLAAGDTADIREFGSVAYGVVTGSSSTYFSGHLISVN